MSGLDLTARNISEESVVAARPDNLVSALGSEAVILNIGNGHYYGLNTTGAFIWQVVQQPVTMAEIEHRVCEEFDVSPEQCRSDLRKVIEDMVEHGIVEVK